MRTLAEWAVCSVFAVVVLFVAGISTFWRWWRSPLGMSVVMLDIALGVTLMPSVLGIWGLITPDTPFWQWFTIAGFFAIALLIPWRGWVLFRVQLGPEDNILTNRQALRYALWLARHPARAVRGRWWELPWAEQQGIIQK